MKFLFFVRLLLYPLIYITIAIHYKNNNNLDTHNEYPSPIMTITDITITCDILAY